jgi:23S rRNA (cytosine1962-C5)-methyltransferase
LHLNTFEKGQVGMFPEQKPNWKAIRSQVKSLIEYQQKTAQRNPIKILNGFAYTGGSTLACLVDPSVTVRSLFL